MPDKKLLTNYSVTQVIAIAVTMAEVKGKEGPAKLNLGEWGGLAEATVPASKMIEIVASVLGASVILGDEGIEAEIEALRKKIESTFDTDQDDRPVVERMADAQKWMGEVQRLEGTDDDERIPQAIEKFVLSIDGLCQTSFSYKKDTLVYRQQVTAIQALAKNHGFDDEVYALLLMPERHTDNEVDIFILVQKGGPAHDINVSLPFSKGNSEFFNAVIAKGLLGKDRTNSGISSVHIVSEDDWDGEILPIG